MTGRNRDGRLAEVREEGIQRHDSLAPGGYRLRPMRGLDRRTGRALGRAFLPGALHAPPAPQQLVRGQPGQGVRTDRRRADSAMRPKGGGCRTGRWPVGPRLPLCPNRDRPGRPPRRARRVLCRLRTVRRPAAGGAVRPAPRPRDRTEARDPPAEDRVLPRCGAGIDRMSPSRPQPVMNPIPGRINRPAVVPSTKWKREPIPDVYR